MRTVDVTQTSGDIVQLLDQARHDDVVVRLADGTEFLVTAIDESDHESARMRGNARLMELLESRAKCGAAVSLDDVKKRLSL